MKIELGRLPDPALNPNAKLHYMQLHKAKRMAGDLTMLLVLEQGKPAKPYKRAHISVTWIAGDKRRRDEDNLIASLKPYIDKLVTIGVIEDDSVRHVTYAFKYTYGRKGYYNTIIEVEDMS
jgi:Holliday junction resolvase RusA-like endonuclease